MNDNDNSENLSQAGALYLLLGQNQIQEATVVSTGYSGQFGGAAGGNINYLTKSGGSMPFTKVEWTRPLQMLTLPSSNNLSPPKVT